LTDIAADIMRALQQSWIAVFNQRDMEGLVVWGSSATYSAGNPPDGPLDPGLDRSD